MALKKLPGVHAPHRKNTCDCVPERIPVPETVTLPMSMHIGAPAKPMVKPGESVKVGQVIAEAGGFVSAPVHASVSGKVKGIEDILMSGGQTVPAIVIQSDGLQEKSEDISPPDVTDLPSFLNAVRASGVVGLGGAGFPTAVKLTVKDLSAIEAVIVNGAECEPYITSDTRTMIDDADYVWEGVLLLKKHLGVKRVIIAIEDNKKECIKNFEAMSKGIDGVEVQVLPSLYPQGGEKVLIFNTIGRIVPEGKLPIDAGAIVINCTTLAVIAKYIRTGMPLTEKYVTVDGSAVKSPKNVIAPLGTPIRALFDYCGGFKSEPKKVLYGGPMMGIAVPDLDVPLLKNNNAVLAFDEKDALPPKETACIKCGRCIAHCPLGLMATDIEKAYKLGRGDMLEELKVNLCMECGCCSYVCPAKRPLVQTNKLAKLVLRDYQSEKKLSAEKEKARAEANRAKEESAGEGVKK